MKAHLYAFGSVCRGEVDRGSDVDLLACTDGHSSSLDPAKFSIYQYSRIREMWSEGNPFAWHLHLESKLLFAHDGVDFLAGLGAPAPYRGIQEDRAKFRKLFKRSKEALLASPASPVFNLSCIFLAARNYATCHTLTTENPIFSRMSPFLIKPKLQISDTAISTLMRARLLSTRGYGDCLASSEIEEVIASLDAIDAWMERVEWSFRK